MRTSDRSPRNTKQSALFIAPNAPTTSARPSSQPLIAPSRTDNQSILFCQEELPRHWRHPSTRRSCTSIPQPAAALPSLYLPSPSIERADRAAYAEGVVPPLPRRAHTVPGTKAGQGVQGAWGCPSPGPLPPAAQATRPFPHKKQKRPEEKEFFRPGRPPRQPRTACPPVRRAQVVGCGERGRLPLSGPIRKGLPGRAHRLKFEAFQFRHGKIGMEQGRIPGIGPQQQAQAQGDHQAGHPGRGRGDDAFVAGAARNGPRVRNPRPAARSRARTAPPPRRNVLPVTFSAQGRPDSPGPHPYLAACPANFFHRLPHAARPGPDGPPCRAGRAP